MPLTVPEFGLKVGSPYVEGLTTKFGFARDWRCYAESRSRGAECPWELRNAEYISPLKAIAPAGLSYPRDMTGWTVQPGKEDKFRTCEPDWARKATSYAFVDGAIYTSASAAGGQLGSPSAFDSLVPRFAVWMERKPPPIGQGVFSGVAIGLPALKTVGGVEQPARLTLVLPLEQASDDEGYQWDEPALHFILESDIGSGDYVGVGSYNLFTDGEVLVRGPKSSAMQHGAGREGWLFEYEEDEDLYSGGHILIRCVTDDGERYWHYHDRNLRVVSTDEAVTAGATWNLGKWVVRCQGAPLIFNLSPIHYGDNDGYAWPQNEHPLPDAVATNDVEADSYADDGAAAWGSLNSCPSGWTVTEGDPADGSHRPYILFERTGTAYNERPVLWFATETHAAVIGDADATAREDTDAAGVHRMIDVRWTWGENWKHSEGEAVFSPETAAYYEDWRENANVILTLGWASGAGAGLEADEYAQGYILPGGIPRRRDGGEAHGDPQVGPVRFGGFDVARLPQKAVVDVRQAGGMTVGDWAAMVAGALGIAPSRLYVAPAVADDVIPPHEIPSLPALAPRDGASWESHIAEVERAANIRCCWNRELAYDLYIDGGAPEYEDGVSAIALEIDYQALADEDKLQALEHEATNDRFRNRLKVLAGPHEEREEYYYAETLAERKASIGDDWPAVLEAEDAEAAELREQFDREHRDGASRLMWRMPMRPDLRPDMFVRITDCPGVGVTTDAVYRIVSHTLETHAQEAWAESIITAVRVYEPAGDGYGY